ncbi:MAG TPA: NfeD family protein [Burkholderiales bacterium]|nr:NfeD family protein [Burkholderiales bacterium]
MDLSIIVALAAIGAILIAVDFFLPGFVLAAIGVVFMVVATVICGVNHSLTITLALICGEILIAGLAGWLSLKYFPRTKVGQHMILQETLQAAHASPGASAELVGREGVAQTVLRPAGIAQVDGRRLDVVAESDMIERGSPIKVVGVEGSHIIVRKIQSESFTRPPG